MAFCNSCGKELVSGTKFCNQCGASVSASPASAPSAIPAPPAKSGSALKVVLIVVAVIVGLGVFAVAGFSYFIYHVAKSSHVRQEGSNMKVDTPFGTIESSQDPEKVSQNLGIDIYPGAQMKKNGAVESTFGKMHTMTAIFENQRLRRSGLQLL
jgi:zinc-ribbon domain